MNLATTYMGFALPHPVVPGASPLAERLDTVRRLEDAGAPLIVLQSLFEEFCTCFNDADAVVVAEVYAAGETPIEIKDLSRPWRPFRRLFRIRDERLALLLIR